MSARRRAYAWSGQAWWGFAVLLFAPDVSMLGYIAGPGPGAIVYNAVHTVAPPLIGLCAAVMPGQTVRAGLALIWLAHIGRDRMLGFGDTHLSAPARARMTATTPR